MSRKTGRPSQTPASETDDARASRAFGKYAGIGVQFAVSILLFLYAGQWLDRRLHSAPWGVLGGVAVGASAAFYSMYRRLMSDLERGEQGERERRARRAAPHPSDSDAPDGRGDA